MEDDGMDFDEVIKHLVEARDADISFGSGRILGSMCTAPHPIAVRAHNLFMEANLGNPGLYPGTASLEREVVSMLGELLHLERPEGHILSGGTEANITAMHMAVNRTGKRKILYPRSAHFSVLKGIKLLDLDGVPVDLDNSYRMDTRSLEDSMGEDVAMVFTVAGSTELGMVDPLERIASICGDVPLHVDAAFGGFVLPSLADMGMLPDWVGRWDFSLQGITSISMDPHKMGLATIPAGCLLFRDMDGLTDLFVESPYLTSPRAYTLAGTRASGAVAGVYAVMRHLGKSGYRTIVRRSMETTGYLRDRLAELSLEQVVEPLMNVLAVHHSDPDRVLSLLRKRGWFISKVCDPPALRFVVMPHVTRETVDLFIPVLEMALREV